MQLDPRLDLDIENVALRLELDRLGGFTWLAPDLDPAVENTFLKQILAFDKAALDEAPPDAMVAPLGDEPLTADEMRALFAAARENAR